MEGDRIPENYLLQETAGKPKRCRKVIKLKPNLTAEQNVHLAELDREVDNHILRLDIEMEQYKEYKLFPTWGEWWDELNRRDREARDERIGWNPNEGTRTKKTK